MIAAVLLWPPISATKRPLGRKARWRPSGEGPSACPGEGRGQTLEYPAALGSRGRSRPMLTFDAMQANRRFATRRRSYAGIAAAIADTSGFMKKLSLGIIPALRPRRC